MYVSKPVKKWHEKFTVSLAQLVKSSISLASNTAAGNIFGASKNLIDVKSSFSRADLSDAERAWLLIARAFGTAISQLMYDVAPTINISTPDDRLTKILEPLERKSLRIDPTFFSDPKNSEICECLTDCLQAALVENTLSTNEASTISKRLSVYLVKALHQEWLARRSEYEGLEKIFDSPFFDATDKEFRWHTYNSWLQQSVQEPIFGEAFGLEDLYVRLRCTLPDVDARQVHWQPRPKASKNPKQNVAGIENFLDIWLQDDHSDHSMKVVCGGPGSGKSTFLRIWAKNIVNSDSGYQPLVIPLHYIDPANDLYTEIGKFCIETGFFRHNPLDPEQGERKLLLLLDGLDELAMQGRIAQEIAQDFLIEVRNLVGRVNMRETRMKVVIGGRELVVQANKNLFRQNHQILNLLPYYLSRDDRYMLLDHTQEGSRLSKLNIPKSLRKDYRQDWWCQYGKLTGANYGGLPEDLARKELLDVTKQPLLNYLLALSYRRGEVDFRYESNINVIYQDLVKRVYDRGWAENRNLPVSSIDFEDFVRILEEVALAAWHGDGRKASLKEIEDKCRKGNLSHHLEAFETGAERGVANLLMAFYFREADKRVDGEKTFEFTHKSFGEYLTSLRVTRFLYVLSEEMERSRKSPDRGWSVNTALMKCVEILGPAPLDLYVVEFIYREIRRYKIEEVNYICYSLKQLVEMVAGSSVPVDTIGDGPGDLITKNKWASNVESALIVLLHVMGRCKDEAIEIEWKSPHSAQQMLARCFVGSLNQRNKLVRSCLGYLSFRGQRFVDFDFADAEFKKTNFEDCLFANVLMNGCDYDRCSFENSEIMMANFSYSEISETSFANCIGGGCIFRSSHISRGNFHGCAMFGSVFDDSVMTETSFRRGSFCYSDFRYSILIKIDFVESDLSYSIFDNAQLFDCLYSKAKRVKVDKDLGELNVRDKIGDVNEYSELMQKKKFERDIAKGGRLERFSRSERKVWRRIQLGRHLNTDK